MLRALILDFDGLMVDTETAIIDAWTPIHADDGFTPRQEVLRALVGHVGFTIDVWPAYPATHDKAALEVRWKESARRLMFAAPVLPGVAALLAEAKAAGLKLAVASNSSREHVHGHLRHRQLDRWFDTICTRDEVERPKPEPDIYRLALTRLGVAPGEAIAFEDSRPGHEAAHRAGLRVIVIPGPSTRHDAFPHAFRQFASMAEVSLSGLAALPPGGLVRRRSKVGKSKVAGGSAARSISQGWPAPAGR
jgi:putative hydrolase of the HAD superfamily